LREVTRTVRESTQVFLIDAGTQSCSHTLPPEFTRQHDFSMGNPIMRKLSLYILRISAALVFVAGALHLLMTSDLMHWFSVVTLHGSDIARAAMLLDYLVVGILLLPLGISLAAIGRPPGKGEPCATAIGVTNGVVK
jgi:hypothetical protein